MPTGNLVTIVRKGSIELDDSPKKISIPAPLAEILVFLGDYDYVGRKCIRVRRCQSLEQLSSEIKGEVKKIGIRPK